MTNPWTELPHAEPFVLNSDRPFIEAFNARAKPKTRIHVEVLPEPYLGRPDAPVVLLNRNPGFKETTVPFHQRDTYFIATLRRNLAHEQSAYPFYLLDPQNERSPGYDWWNRRLKDLIVECSREQVTNGVLCVEYFPYASISFGFRSMLPSQIYSFDLVREAIHRNAIIIRMRGESDWLKAVPELRTHERFYRLRSNQNVSVTRNNCPEGYPEIIRALRGIAKEAPHE